MHEVCRGYAAGLVLKVVEFIKNTSPHQFCKMIRQCNSTATTRQDLMEQVVFMVTDDQQPEDGEHCEACRKAYEEARRLLTDSNIMSILQARLEEICSIQRPDVQKPCADAVKIWAPRIRDFMDYVDQFQFCKYAGFCRK